MGETFTVKAYQLYTVYPVKLLLLVDEYKLYSTYGHASSYRRPTILLVQV